MPNFQFIGQFARFYPDIMTGTGSLIAEPGDVRSFDEPPSDGQWVETSAPEAVPAEARTWPPATLVQDTAPLPEAAPVEVAPEPPVAPDSQPVDPAAPAVPVASFNPFDQH